MLSAQDALQRLLEGNRRFVSGTSQHAALTSKSRRLELLAGQDPVAVVIGCSDSRVPVETIFDQGLGDLFVIRVAGNILNPPLLGSVEYAVEHLGTRLVIMLGHSQCGAVKATIGEMRRATPDLSPNLGAVVDPIRRIIEPVVAAGPADDRAAVLRAAVHANTLAWTTAMRRESAIIRRLIHGDGLQVIPALYSLETGLVECLEEPPDEA